MPVEIDSVGGIRRTGGGNTSTPRGTAPNTNNNNNGWWIIVALILLFVGYEIISNWSTEKSIASTETNPTVTTSPNDNNQYSPPQQETYTPPSTIDTSSISSGVENSSLSNGTDNSNPQPEKVYLYGEGYGKLTFYKTCNSCPNLEVSIDGDYLGTLTETLNSSASCGDYGTISKILSVGNHTITGKDSYGTTYKGTAYVSESECMTDSFSKPDDVNPNPYGTGNGQITIYHNCSNCGNVQVSVDGYYSGTLSQYFSNGSPSCGSQNGGTVVKNLFAGSHTITAKDEYGNTWSGYVYVDESSCKTYALQNFTQENPYGYDNGKVSFFTSSRYGHDIYIDGTFYGSLNQYFTGGSVTCGQSGTLSIILSQGSHSFSATDNNGAWNGTFTIVAGQCSIIQVNRRY